MRKNKRQTPLEDVARGEAHGNAKLSDSEIAALRALRRDGLTLRALAEKFELSTGYISKLCQSKRRAHAAP